ncbi:hypothetical protein [Sphingobium sp.]|uniref:hypothetical protein n=1 Tax=Sphingobium sp. TaxID=1912891 RepID=UPI00261A6063|nr:hypothetical protein [Sphingobium sp.]
MSRRSKLLSVLAFIGVFSAFYIATGPWENEDQQAYDALAAASTQVVIRRASAANPDAIKDCMLAIPPSLLNLRQLKAGDGIILANPVQHLLITIIAEGRGAQVTVRRPPDRTLRRLHRAALLRCLG